MRMNKRQMRNKFTNKNKQEEEENKNKINKIVKKASILMNVRFRQTKIVYKR